MVAFAVMCSGLRSASTLARAFGGDYLAEFVSVPTVLVALRVPHRRGGGQRPRDRREREGQRRLHADRAERPAARRRHRRRRAPRRRRGPGPGARDQGAARRCSPAVMAAAGLAFYAMIGFEDSVNVAEEARDPQRNYPRALFGGLLIAGLVYLAVSVVASMAVPTDKLAASDGPLLEVVTARPAGGQHEAVRRDRAVRGRQQRAHQHDHGLAAAVRDVGAGDRPRRVLEGAARAPHAVGRDRVHDAPRDGPRLDRRPQRRSPT